MNHTDSSSAQEMAPYDEIIRYFLGNPLGLYPWDMTTLSYLLPIDRCMILESLYPLGGIYRTIDWIDKLSMAYLKVGRKDLSMDFLKACSLSKICSDSDYNAMINKIESLYAAQHFYASRISRNYSDTLKKMTGNGKVEWIPGDKPMIDTMAAIP